MLARWRPIGVFLLLMGACSPPRLPHEGKSVSELARMLENEKPAMQAQGALGLSLHGPEAAEAVPLLRRLLGSPVSIVRQQSALALGKIGPPAREAQPDLERLLGDPDWPVRRQAALALGGLGQPSARSALEKARTDSNRLVQQAVGEALGKLSREKQ